MIPNRSTFLPIHSPVLEGLSQIGLSGKEIAALSDVSAPTVSKWRGGKTRPPAAAVIFLTLVLAHKLEELEEIEWQLDGGGEADDWALDLAEQVDSARRCLKVQERVNGAISPEAIHEGARRYRDWFNSGTTVRHRAGGAGIAEPVGAPA